MSSRSRSTASAWRCETLGGERPAGAAAVADAVAARPTPPLEFPLPLKAGPKLVGVAFVQRTEARDEATLRPRMRSRGTQPAIASGHDQRAATTSARRAIRRAAAASSSAGRRGRGRGSCRARAQILSTLARRAYRRPVTDVDLRDLMPFFEQGRAEGSFDLGIQKALERLLVSSQFLFRIERPAGRAAAAGHARIASAISSWRRGCRSSCGAAFPTTSCSTLAVAGRLKEPAVLEQQVRRMLADPRVASRWSRTSPRSGSTCATSRRSCPTRSCSRTSTRRCAQRCSARPSCSSTASSARTAACSSC